MSTGGENSFLKIIDDKFKISKRGRSLQLTIPVDVAKMLKFEHGDYVKFVVDEENEIAMIMKKNKLPAATVEIDGVGRRAMYFTSKRIKLEDMGKEGADAYIRHIFNECGKIGGIKTIEHNKWLQKIIDYYDIDINAFTDESES